MKATFVEASIGSVALTLVLLAACSGGGGSPPPVTIGGTVSGLAGLGLVLVKNGVDRLAVSTNGSFTFVDSVPVGDTYGVDVLTQPTNPIQICTVSGGDGMAGTTNVATIAVTCTTQPLALFAGNLDGSGTVDGVGIAARFNYPQGLAADGAGNLYVADTDNNTIRVITPAGVVSTLAGQPGISGSADGSGASARFLHPGGIAIDAAGSIYVADTNNVTVRKITPTGVVTTIAGNPGSSSSSDGTGTAAGFSGPRGIATDSLGNVYVADTDANTIRKITPAGLVTTLAGTAGSAVGGSADGRGAAASFSAPWGIAADTAGNLYVTDSGNSTIRKITPAGLVTTFAGEAGASGTADGIGTGAKFALPKGIAIDSAGNLYVADNFGDAIRKITPAGVVTTLASKLSSNAQNPFNDNGITIDNSGSIDMADSTSTIRKITSAGVVTTLAGTTVVAGSADGSRAAARFNGPFGIATDTAGNVYVADSANQAVREITPTGVVSTLTSTVPGGPAGICADTAGNLYVTAISLDTSLILKVTPGGVLTTLAGHSGLDTYEDGIGTAAAFFDPLGTATDKAGNVYVADSENYAVRKITTTGVVTTLAGGPTQCFPPQPCYISPFAYPVGVATDSAGNIYVADQGNNTVDKITPAGVLSTLAGQPGISGSADGNGAAAQFNNPKGVATDATGNVYVADFGNSTIRKITPDGVVSTVVGTPGQAGFVAGPLPGVIGYPMAVAINGNSLFITLYNGVAVVQGIP